MGIYGALSSAVTGLRAQSHALENISGNIANSQTTGYKRVETSFVDLIPDAPLKSQVPGAVLAQSRATNTIQGDIQTSTTETFIALNTNGFFVVEPKVGQSDGNAVFAGSNFYTRRGDFQIDKDGLLVNGAGYYLKGLDIDLKTGNISGSVPGVIRLSNAFLPANATRIIEYQANLPQLPKTASYKATQPHSELIKPWTYANPSPLPAYPQAEGVDLPNADVTLVPARAFGTSPLNGTEAAATLVDDGDRLTTTIGGSTYNLWFDTDGNPNSAVQYSASVGSDPLPPQVHFSIADSNLGSLHANDDLYIGSVHIPFSSGGFAPTKAGLQQAIETALGPDYSVFFEYATVNGRQLIELTYPFGATPASTVTGTNLYFESSAPQSSGSSAQTQLTISEHDIVGLHRSAEPFEIGGIAIGFSAPAYPATKEGLLAAITDAFAASAPAGTTVSPAVPIAPATLPAGPFSATITYPAGARTPDTVVGGSSTVVDATGDVDTVLASMEAQLRDLTGDATLFVKLVNERITVSSGHNDPDPLQFVSARAGGMAGDILGLDPGPHAAIPGSAMTALNTYADLLVNDNDTLVVRIGDEEHTFSFDTDGRQTPAAGEHEINASGSLAEMLASLQAGLRAHGGWAAAAATVSYGPEGIAIGFPGNYYYDVTISGSASAANKLGIAGTYPAATGGLPYITAADGNRFLNESIEGGAVTAYAENGAPVNVQMRWAKLDSGAADGLDTWHLYYLADSKATGGSPMWMRVDQDYVFGTDGSLVPPGVREVTIDDFRVGGVSIGKVTLKHEGGMSQFADVNGTVSVSKLTQNGYGAGEFLSVAITDAGRVVATYSNGERIEMAQVVTAQFNGANLLKRLDGGVYEATSESGEPILDLSGSGIIGGALEASNTDISDEFTKLIVTQQAYSAGTRIVSVADEMLQEALNMVR
ncbi:flagellar hook-basal body protein [Devosia lucknowensis]|uniref:Flagellar hook protein FlgE n=1 Tax=Devosia lucknowensis TaxID=1096929 RepID=A0A1Y6E7Z8_9HYPH|nr:flagellar hook-basal body complex protein [Devosia lucknowensis]SMQ58746.1 flagellar hook-basal body protein [Devosia lucknowensis]